MFQVFSFLLVAALGVWLGAQYLGVDVRHLAYTALDETDLIEHIPDDWRPAAPLPAVGDAEGQISFEERAVELRSVLEELRSEVASIRQNEDESTPGIRRPMPSSFSTAPPARRQATLAYWTRLRQIASEVTDLHDGVEVGLTETSASTVFDIRRRAFEYGATAIDSVDFKEVDQQAIDAGFRIAKWYREGAGLYQRASEVWEGRVADQPIEALEKSLETARAQHARQAEIVRQLTARTEEILMRRYAVEFPVLSI